MVLHLRLLQLILDQLTCFLECAMLLDVLADLDGRAAIAMLEAERRLHFNGIRQSLVFQIGNQHFQERLRTAYKTARPHADRNQQLLGCAIAENCQWIALDSPPALILRVQQAVGRMATGFAFQVLRIAIRHNMIVLRLV